MKFRIGIFFIVLGTCLAAWVPAVGAQTWGETLFRVKTHDFGRVAIGSDSVFRFEMENLYEEDVRILGVHSSCGCTIPSAPTRVLKSEEKGEVVARFNTNGQHTREKSATLTVELETVVGGKTLRDTVLLSVSGYIRPDVVLTPGIVEFGSVREGQPVVRTVLLEYAGRNDWSLTKINRSNPFIHAKAEGIRRSGGDVAYQITVTLKKDAPIGYVRDVLRFTTNEKKPGQTEPVEIVLPIQGVVMAPIHAKPSPFMLGILTPGESVSKNIVVRSDTPFRILEVSSSDTRFRFTFSEEESTIQLVSALFSAKRSTTDQTLTISDEIRIRTNLPDQEFVTLRAQALLAPKEFLAQSGSEPPPFEVANRAKPVTDGVRLNPDLSGAFVAPVLPELKTSALKPTGGARFGTPTLQGTD